MSSNTPPLSGPPPKPQVHTLNCPKCGAAITLRTFGQAETVACGSCRCILDAKDPNLAILQQFEKLTSDIHPLIPLGTRGKLRGTDYEVIGFQRRHARAFHDGIFFANSDLSAISIFEEAQYSWRGSGAESACATQRTPVRPPRRNNPCNFAPAQDSQV